MHKTILGFALACSIPCLNVSRADAPGTQPSTQPSPQTSLIQRGSLSIAVDGQGAFDPVDAYEVRLRLKVYGGELTVASVAANGSAVKKGDVLLEIDPANMNRTLAAVENETLLARANLEKAESDARVAADADALALRQQQEAVREAEQGVKWFETVDGPQMLKQTDLGVEQAKNQVNDEQDELDQLKKMYKSEELTNATADIVVKRALRQLELSKTVQAMAEQHAKKAHTFTFPTLQQRVNETLEMARQQFTMFESAQQQGKIYRQTGLAAAHAAGEAAQLKLADLKADAEKLTVRAPADGVACYGQVLNGAWTGGDPRTLKPGEHVTAQAVLMTVFQPGRLRVVLDLPEAKFFAIQPGQKASISPVAFPELKYEGMCDAVPRTASAGSSGATYAMTISTGDVDAKLVPGMKAQVHMDVPLVQNVVLAPTSAIKDATVWVKTAAGVDARHVLTGRTDGKSVEVLSGLHDGEEVLTQAK